MSIMKVKNKLLAINAISLLLYAPNYLSLLLPIVKIVPIFTILVTFLFLIKQPFFKLSKDIYFFGFIPIIILLLGFINGLRFDNMSTINFSITFMLKFIHMLLIYFLIIKKEELLDFIKYLIYGIVFISLHTNLQFFLNMFSLISSQGSIVTQGYEYINLGIWGFYRVGFGFEGLQLIRAQSFFQEPAFLAFYLLFGLLLINFIKYYGYKIKLESMYKVLISLSIFLTFSFTGIVLLIFIYLFYEKNKIVRVILSLLGVCLVVFILTSDNQYVNKIGSFLLRLEDFTEIFEVFQYPINYYIGIGYNNENYFVNAKANNFIIELFLYGSILSVIIFIIFSMYFYSKNRNTQGLTMLYLFVLTVPLFWSPIIFLMILLINKANHIIRNERRYYNL